MEGNENSNGTPSGGQEGEKELPKPGGGNIEKLSREELVSKCRNLLALAQKAKSAKDEATAELKKFKASVKNQETASAEADALREMVADLTEGKLVYTTKIDSLQRQLKVSSSEVESLRIIEEELVKERDHLITENHRLAEEKKNCQEKIQNFNESSSENLQLLEQENLALQERVENLEAQNGQVDILKTKCKKLLEEKSSLEEELQKLQKQNAKSTGELKSLKEEKKANVIILEAAKSEKNSLIEKLKNLESQIAGLQKGKEETDKLQEELSQQKSSLARSEASFQDLQDKFSELLKDKESIEEKSLALKKEIELSNQRFDALNDELRIMSEGNHQLKNEVEKLKLQDGKLAETYTLRIENLELELSKSREDHQNQLSSNSCQIQEDMEKIKELEGEKAILTDKINNQEDQLSEKNAENNKLHEQLKVMQTENSNLSEQLAVLEREQADSAGKKSIFEDQCSQLEKLKQELHLVSEEKLEVSKKYEDLEMNVGELREQLKMAELLKENLESEVSKCMSNADAKMKDETEQRENLQRMVNEISDLKTANTELEAKAEQLQNSLESHESVLSELSSSGNTLLLMCQKLYPSSYSVLPQEKETDVREIILNIINLFNNVASKKEESKYDANLILFAKELEIFHGQCKNMSDFSDRGIWNVHAECFERLTSSLLNFYRSIALVVETSNEKDTSLESRFEELSSVYRQLCTSLEQEACKIINLEEKIKVLGIAKLKTEEQLEELNKDKEASDFKLNDVQSQLSKFKRRCMELETQITSGDSEMEQIVHGLREQLVTLGNEKDFISSKLKEIQIEKEELEKCLEKERLEMKNVIAERDDAVKESKAAQVEKEHLESIFSDFKSQCITKEKCLNDEKQDLEKKLTILSEEKINLEKEFASLNSNRKSIEEESERDKKTLSAKVQLMLEEKEHQEEEMEKFRSENQNLQDNISKLNAKTDELNSEILALQETLKSSELTIQTLQDEKEISEKNLKEAENNIIQLNTSVETSSSRCEELLSELNDMNKVLRERGERISRLEASSKEKLGELEATKSQLQDLQNKISSSEAELASKQEQLQTITEKLQSFNSDSTDAVPAQHDEEINILKKRVEESEQENIALKKTIRGLESELQSGRENVGPGHDAQSEVMSTSTISRAEDCQRMKELEDTFEERYMKLKSVAIRLKKRVAELTAQLNAAEENRNKLVSEKEDLKKRVDGGSKESIKAASKNIQVMQGEIDRLQDELDGKKKELKECGKQLNSAAEQLANVKSELAACQEESSSLLKTLKNQEETLSMHRDESSSLRGQIAALEKRLAAESELQQSVEERRKKAEERMEEERLKAAQFSKELEEAKQDIKNKSLMDLEMRDYELTVEELNGKLAERDASITELQADISREKGRSSSLQDQLTHLTAQEATERERAEKMKKLLLDHKTQLAELRQSQEGYLAAQENDRVTIEELTQELEKQKLVMSEISNEKTKLENLLRKNKTASERQIEILEEQLAKHKSDATQLQSELEAVKKEFEGYKVRATSVLRQKARAPEVDVNELKGEKDQLQEDYETAQLKIQQLQSELSALRAEHSFLQSEKEGIARQLSSVTDDLSKRETLHRERVTNLESKMESKVAEYQLIIANMSSQNDKMSNSFKKQLETMRQNHSREVEEITVKLEDAEDKLWQLKNTISTSTTAASNTSATSLAVSHPLRLEHNQSVAIQSGSQHRRQPSNHGCDEARIDVTNMVREEGEGSEWVEPVHRSPGRPGGYSPPPLDQLISSPMPSNVGIPQQDDTVSITSINTDATSKEIARLESKVASGEMRVLQLTSLLHESEEENAKLVQLSDALKEEIRRTSRNENREKHMENMEYMKNIILKFLVMKNGEERKHMVPVLKTVLQLSPQETSDLEHLALGGEEGPNAQGWGSYLHLWSSR